ncbi:lipocalin family protein [Hoyosella rhizosphaerae]|uniref:Lipocalin n=1 Tax=Hoyosella rhizosphaerae TaxID=1755582 RepID=A0A916U1B7_9ACTN|nr:lipocalin family protein [Hoyosella rhizosphaerae]MBN4927262.1 lipocalin family protein [Hoyosella rhizosphaerae]GGC52670.1 lipocalin [Hoyosella rhizosphaerae]
MNSAAHSPRLRRGATTLLAALALAITPAAAASAFPGADSLDPVVPGPLPSVPSLDVERYAGTWLQVAAVPQLFSLDCARDTRATYGIIGEGQVSVNNECTTWTGDTNTIEGVATVTDANTNASLQVAFPSVPFQLPEGLPNYVVTFIDDDYSLAIVGDPARSSGFVLSRTPDLSDQQWRNVRDIVASRGWNPCFFLTTPAAGGKNVIQPLCTV